MTRFSNEAEALNKVEAVLPESVIYSGTVMSLAWLKFWLVGWQPFQNRNRLELFLACN